MSRSDGVVYTKDWVARLVLDVAGYVPTVDLCSKTIVEPACGDGVFLTKITERLCARARELQRLDVDSLRKCVCAYDVSASAVETSTRAVVQTLVSNGFTEEDAHALARSWIHCEDFLLAKTTVAHWVVGNPPYIRATHMAVEQRTEYASNLTCMTMGTDLYVGFFEKGLKTLDAEGALCFICSDRWLQNRYGTRLRRYAFEDFDLKAHIRMHDVDAFEEDVSSYPAITRIDNRQVRKFRYVECKSGFDASDAAELVTKVFQNSEMICGKHFTGVLLNQPAGSNVVTLAHPSRVSFFEKAERTLPTLEEAGVQVGIGIASGSDAVYLVTDPTVVEQDRLLPIFYMRDWRRGQKDTQRWLVNPWNDNGSLVDLNEFPRMQAYFTAHERQLRNRRVARDHPEAWYRTLDKPNYSLLGKTMLLLPDMSAHAEPVLSDGSLYPHHNCYWITSSTWDLRALGGLLMSEIVNDYVSSKGVKMRGGTLRFQAQYLRMIHIPYASRVSKKTMEELKYAFMHNDVTLANVAARNAYAKEGVQ